MLESLNINSHYVARDTDENDSLATFVVDNKKQNRTDEQSLSDEALMAGYANGNVTAFETLYKRHKDPLLRYFIRQVDTRAIAEELFQETWQNVIKASGSYKSSAKFTTYLYHIARNRLIDCYRKQGKVDWSSLDEDGALEPVAASDNEPEKQLAAIEAQQSFESALAALPVAQKEVLILKFDNGMTVQDIAETIGDNPEAVKSRLRYAVQKLKQILGSNEQNAPELEVKV